LRSKILPTYDPAMSSTSDVAGSSAWHLLESDWERSLRSAQLSRGTIALYLRHLRYLREWLNRNDRSAEDPEAVAKRDLEDYFADLGERQTMRNGKPGETVKSTYLGVAYRSLKQFWKWLAVEEIVTADPFDKMKPPKVIEPEIPILPTDAVHKLLATCEGRSFTQLRDTAMIRMMLDNGVRVSGLAGQNIEDFDFDRDLVRTTMKGGREIYLPFGAKTSDALRRYRRKRAVRKGIESVAAMWIGERNTDRLKAGGIRQMLERRAAEAGLQDLATNPHAWRHLFAHNWKANGGSEQDLAMLMGWTSTRMAARYGASAAAQRAREAHRRSAPGDKY
jgi:site-specific recombinase XerD